MPVGFETVTEACDECDRETPHDVRLEQRTENAEADMSYASREPYRISECQTCGATSERRMNNA